MTKHRCDYKGLPTHDADYMLLWELQSGPMIRWSCAEHRLKFNSHHGYWIADVLGWWEQD